EAGAEVRMRTADDCPIGEVNRAVVVDVPELDPAGTRPGAPIGSGVQGIQVETVRYESIERPDGMADHVDRRVLPAQRNGPEKSLTPDVVDAEDRVPVVAAAEARAEHGRAARPVAEGEVDAVVSHLPGMGKRRGEPQAVRLTPIDI